MLYLKSGELFINLTKKIALKKGWPVGFEPTRGDPQSPMLAKLHHGHHKH